MTRRALSLVLAFSALPGLLGVLGSVISHEHEDGDRPHRHGALVGHLDHGHAGHHGHSHEHGSDSESPADDPKSPTDGERHGHYLDLVTHTVRRGSATAQLLPDLSEWVPACWLVLGEPGTRATENPLPPAECRGHPPSRCARTTTRLVQGLGLLI